MTENRIVPWGESYNPAMKMSRGLGCPTCGWSFATLGEQLEKFKSIVGFSDQMPFETRGLGVRKLIGIIIIECPECFEKYCFHTDAAFARTCMDYCDNWPKDNAD